MSERAQKILSFLTPLFEKGGSGGILPIRQQSLAEQFGCSRRSIGRALKELKEAGLLIDLNQRHENRCKMYEVKIPPAPLLQRGEKATLTPEAQLQWDKFEKTFRIVFKMPELPTYYAEVTWGLDGIKDENELWSKTFAGLWAMGL